jgi:hypothetical protein
VTEGVARGDHRAGDFTGSGGIECDVKESRSRDVNRLDARERRQCGVKSLCNIARVHVHPLGDLQRDRRRPIAVVAIFGALERDIRIRNARCNGLIASADDRPRRLGNGGAQRVGVHDSILRLDVETRLQLVLMTG